MRRLLSLFIILPFALTSCSNESTDDNAPKTSSPTTTTSQEPENHSLDDDLDIAGVLISDLELSQNGCEFSYPPHGEAIKFNLMATVENTTNEEISQVLSPPEFSFTNEDGFSIRHLDLKEGGESECYNDLPIGFVDMLPGEKRRAAITIVAPPHPKTMTYSTDQIPNADPITWDINNALDDFTVTPGKDSNGDSSSKATTEAPAKQSEATTQAPAEQSESTAEAPIEMTEAPGAAQPSTMNKTIRECGQPRLHQTGTTFFTDGTSGWTQQCADQMNAQMPPVPQSEMDARPTGINIAPEGRYYTQEDLDRGFEPAPSIPAN